MGKFNDMKIAAQLVITMLGLGLIVAIVIGGWSAWSANKALSQQYQMHLESMRDLRLAALTTRFNKIKIDVIFQSERTTVKNAVTALQQFGKANGAGAGTPFPVDAPGYPAVREQFKAIWTDNERAGYYDAMIIDAQDGHVMFTGAKEKDLGTNLMAGPYKTSALAKCWSAVKEKKDVALQDLEAYEPSGGIPAMFIGAPININGVMEGVFVLQINSKELDAILATENGMGTTGETIVYGAEDALARCNARIASKNAEQGMLKLHTESEAFKKATGGATGFLANGKNYDKVPVLVAYAPVELLGQIKWVGVAQINKSEANAPIKQLLIAIVIAIIILAAIVVTSAILTGRRIGIPLGLLANAAHLMGQGDFTIILPHNKNKDEIGTMTEAFIEMKNTTKHLIEQVGSAAAHVASSSEELAAGADETGKAVQQVAQTVQEVARGSQETTQSISAAQQNVAQTAKAIEGVSRDIEAAQQNVTQTAKAIAGVSRDIEDVAAYATQAVAQGNEGKKSADLAVTIIDHAAGSVQQTTVVVHSLGEKTKQIGEFISIITGIADQTNLLALNAAIEAARAGDAGRGFAVVAEEVRKLAEESNGAAGNITKLVRSIEEEMRTALSAMEKSNEEVSTGAKTVGQASALLTEIVKGVDALTERVQGISAAAEEINASTSEVVHSMQSVSAAAEEINASTSEVVHSMQSVAAVAEENAAASEEVSSATEEQTASMEEISASASALAKLAQDLQALVGKFKV
jgi:methyl-accepting chemotaxis protein